MKTGGIAFEHATPLQLLKAVCSSAKRCSGQWQAWWLSGGGVVGLNTSCRP